MRYVNVAGKSVSVIGLGTWQFGSREWRYGSDYANREAVALTPARSRPRHQPDRHRRDLRPGQIRADRGCSDRRPPRPGVPGDEAVSGAATVPGGQAARTGQRKATRRPADRPLPAARAQPGDPAVAGDARLRRPGRGRPHPRRRRQQLLARAVAGGGGARWAAPCCRTRSGTASPRVRPSARSCLGAGQRPPRDRLQPAGARSVVGRYGPHNRPRDVRRRNPLFLPDNLRRAGPLLECVREVAARHGATPAQVALAWLVQRPNVVVIPGARTVAQLEHNVAAAELPLDAADDRQLTQASDRFRPTGKTRYDASVCRTPPRRCDDGSACRRS